ncbi:MAG: hypothetical protein R3D65_02430 [Zhengella sp.]|uniref:hypothetical protein n=1 Tax=Zhengella sp. TaxID=2282762 RepID=UPI001D2FBE01|nr:hypothetical protein [Notoacmeibacter sp.]MCC0026405.1 hypothetical protein [Brucellaceae bacterium]
MFGFSDLHGLPPWPGRQFNWQDVTTPCGKHFAALPLQKSLIRAVDFRNRIFSRRIACDRHCCADATAQTPVSIVFSAVADFLT